MATKHVRDIFALLLGNLLREHERKPQLFGVLLHKPIIDYADLINVRVLIDGDRSGANPMSIACDEKILHASLKIR